MEMKCGVLMALLTAGMAVSAAVADQPATPPSLAWGEAVGGLQVALQVEPPTWQPDQKIAFRLHAKNVSDQPVRVLDWAAQWNCLTLTDANGKAIEHGGGSNRSRETTGTDFTDIPPGQIQVFTMPGRLERGKFIVNIVTGGILHWPSQGDQSLAPGSHQLTAQFNVDSGKQLEIDKRVKSRVAISPPVRIEIAGPELGLPAGNAVPMDKPATGPVAWPESAGAYLEKHLQAAVADAMQKGHGQVWQAPAITDPTAYADYFPEYRSYTVRGQETYQHDGKIIPNDVWQRVLVHCSGTVLDIIKQDQCQGTSLLQPTTVSMVVKVADAAAAKQVAAAYLALMMRKSAAEPSAKLEYTIVEDCPPCGGAGKVVDWEVWKAAGGAKGGDFPTKPCAACEGAGETKRPFPPGSSRKGTWVVTCPEGAVLIPVTSADAPGQVQGKWASSRRMQ